MPSDSCTFGLGSLSKIIISPVVLGWKEVITSFIAEGKNIHSQDNKHIVSAADASYAKACTATLTCIREDFNPVSGPESDHRASLTVEQSVNQLRYFWNSTSGQLKPFVIIHNCQKLCLFLA